MAPSSRSRTSIVPQSPPEVKEEPKKRVQRACDACRVKKTKCDGDKPCKKCATEEQVCTYTQCKKPTGRVFSSEYVELLESKVNLLASSLSILVEALNKGEDVSHVVRSADTPINEVVDKLQAMNSDPKDLKSVKNPKNLKNTKEPAHLTDDMKPALAKLGVNSTINAKAPSSTGKKLKSPRVPKAKSAARSFVEPDPKQSTKMPSPLPCQMPMSPVKQIKIEANSKSPIHLQPAYDADEHSYIHKSPASTVESVTALDFSDATESPVFDEPGSVNEYQSTFAAPLLAAPGFSDRPVGSKFLRSYGPHQDQMLSSPPYTYADAANLQPTNLGGLGTPHPMGPPPSYPSTLLDSAGPANSSQYNPSVGYGTHTPPLAYDGFHKYDLNDILTEKEEFFLW